MKKKFLPLLLLVALAVGAEAQILENLTTFSVKARGEAAFKLNGAEHIYTYEPEDGWFKARKLVYLEPTDVAEGRLSAGAILYNKEGQKIGETMEALRLYEIDTIKGFRKEDRLKAVVQGYVYETKIEEGSIPEKQVSAILALKNRSQQQELFKALWEQTNAENREFDGLDVWVIRETNKGTADEQDFRLIMIFRGGSTPYAVITNDHSVELLKIKEVWEDGDFRIDYFYKSSASQKQQVDDILYNYLAF
jgi:hypothetical protein